MFPPHRSHKENDRYFTCDCLASVEIGIHNNNNNNTIGESELRKVSKRQENKAFNTDEEEEVEVEDDILIYGSRSRKTVTTKKVHLEAP